MTNHGHSHLGHHAAPAGDQASPRHDEAEHRTAANKALLYSAIGLGAAGGIELLFAVFTRSVGLLGDALHNLSDVSTSLLVFLGFWVSKRPASPGHPYGYERAEDIAGIGVVLAIWASAAFAGIESVKKLVHHGGTVHVGWGIAAAVVGVAGNQAVAWYKGRVGNQSNRRRSSPTHGTHGSMRSPHSVPQSDSWRLPLGSLWETPLPALPSHL